MKRLIFFLVIGLGGAGILISLGVWQVQRLGWKQDYLNNVQAMIKAEPVDLSKLIASPETQTGSYTRFAPVTATGIVGLKYLRVLVSRKEVGAGYRIISAFDTEQGKIMVDWGFVKASQSTEHLMPADLGPITLSGNLHRPQETDRFTPAPDTANNVWFARDIDAMRAALGNPRPILIVARTSPLTDHGVTPWPVDTGDIPNNHLQYAITWFSLAFIWLAMTIYFMRTKTPRRDESELT